MLKDFRRRYQRLVDCPSEPVSRRMVRAAQYLGQGILDQHGTPGETAELFQTHLMTRAPEQLRHSARAAPQIDVYLSLLVLGLVRLMQPPRPALR